MTYNRNSNYLWITFIATSTIISTGIIIYLYTKSENANSDFNKSKDSSIVSDNVNTSKKITILYGTCTGTARFFANSLQKKLSSFKNIEVTAVDMKDYEEDQLDQENIVLIICSTWSNGTILDASVAPAA